MCKNTGSLSLRTRASYEGRQDALVNANQILN